MTNTHRSPNHQQALIAAMRRDADVQRARAYREATMHVDDGEILSADDFGAGKDSRARYECERTPSETIFNTAYRFGRL